MTLPAHTRTWQFQPNMVIDDATTAEAGSDALAIGLVNALLGRGSWVDKNGDAVASAGNWSVISSCDGTNFGNGDNVNHWDNPAGTLNATEIVHAAGAHSWIVLRQTGIATNFEVCIDFSNATTTTATVVVSFTAGFGSLAIGSATARPTATDQQILINNTTWGSAGTAGSIFHCMKSTDGKAFRFIVQRANVNVAYYSFEVPDPVVSGWTSPSISMAIGTSNSTSDQMTYGQFTGANTYGKTPGGTIFTSQYCHPGTTSGTGGNQIPVNYGQPNLVDTPPTHTFHEIALYSATTNARYVNGKVVDAFWGQEYSETEIGNYTGMTVPAGGPIQWQRFEALWLPWCANYNPRTSL